MSFPKYQFCLEQKSNPITLHRLSFRAMLSSRYKYIKSIKGSRDTRSGSPWLVVTEEFFQNLNRNRNKYLKFTKENTKTKITTKQSLICQTNIWVVFNPVSKTHNKDDAGDQNPSAQRMNWGCSREIPELLINATQFLKNPSIDSMLSPLFFPPLTKIGELLPFILL